MMKKPAIRFGCAAMAALLLFGSTVAAEPAGSADPSTYYEYKQTYKDAARPDEEIVVRGSEYTDTNDKALKVLPEMEGVKDVLATGSEGFVEWEFDVRQAGLYHIALRYCPLEGKGNAIERNVLVNGEVPYDDLYAVSLNRVYTAAEKERQRDEMGNELRPVQIEAPRFETVTLSGSLFNVSEPLAVYLKEGKNTLRLEAVREPMALDSIRFYQKKDEASYAQVSKGYTAGKAAETIHIEGEDAAFTSDKTLYATSDNSSPLNSPVSGSQIRMNMMGGINWRSPRQYIEWAFHVPEDGLYSIVIRGKQDYNPGQISSRRLTIDGEVPFYEANRLEFPYALGFQNYVLGDGDTVFQFELTAGDHTLRLENNVGPIGDILERLNQVVGRLNGLYKDVFMLTGSYPDADRDYNIGLALPQAAEQIAAMDKDLETIKQDYLDMVGTKGDGYGDMEKIQVQLRSFIKDIETLPARLDAFRINISNLSSWLLSSTDQPLLIDTIDLIPADGDTGRAEAGFFGKLWYDLKSFFISFFVDYNAISEGAEGGNTEAITLWLGTGRDQAQAIKAIINNGFTPQKKIGVNIRLVDLGVLLPAVAAGRGPDIAITLDRSLPMNYAYRGAVQELNDFPGFQEVISRFHPQALTEFQYQGKYYALPDKYTFYMMFYRQDILGEMGIEVPKTWDDVYELLPKLQNKHMGIGLPNIEENNIDMFTTLLYQQGGTVYDEELTKSVLDSDPALKAFKQFTDFYTKYKVSKKLNHLTYFRTGETPIVFMPYTFYANLQAAAPEIKGQWSFAQVPGTVKEDGSVDATVSGTSTGCVIFSNSAHKQAAWEFLKWWTDTEAQVDFGTEIESIQGPSGRYPTANLEALRMLPWSNAELQAILSQCQHTQAMPEAPGGYMTSRYIVSSAMIVINNGLVPRETIMDYNKMINDEVQSMRKKFGLD